MMGFLGVFVAPLLHQHGTKKAPCIRLEDLVHAQVTPVDQQETLLQVTTTDGKSINLRVDDKTVDAVVQWQGMQKEKAEVDKRYREATREVREHIDRITKAVRLL